VNTAQTKSMIKRRFADHGDAVDQAFDSSESFRGLCRDYLACATVLARWRRSDSEDAPARAEEYAALLAELGTELQVRLQETDRLRPHEPSKGDV
jgi:hypothetical protein